MYKGRFFNRETVYVCGDYIDGDIYPVFQRPGIRRKRCKPTKEIQARLNQKNAEKKLTRLVHTNFTEKDLALHLTYRRGSEPADELEAKKDLQNFIRRLKRLYTRFGLELKYISCTEIGIRGGRVHHHLIITGGMDRDRIEQLWGKGFANSKRLQFGEDGVTGLARYMVKDKHFYKRWNQSRNLIIPEPQKRDGSVHLDELEDLAEAIECGAGREWFENRYPGFELVEARAYRNNTNRGVYVSFSMRRILGAEATPEGAADCRAYRKGASICSGSKEG